MIKMIVRAAALVAMTLSLGCWDTIEHVYYEDCSNQPDGQYDVPPIGWEGFGEACETDADCTGYPGERRCLRDVIGLINVPEGYCSACCNEPGYDVCAPGIDCVGADDAYLVCLMHCNSDDDCRVEDGYVCRPIYYIPEDFLGNYCMPDEDVVEPDPANFQELDCPWPWI